MEKEVKLRNSNKDAEVGDGITHAATGWTWWPLADVTGVSCSLFVTKFTSH